VNNFADFFAASKFNDAKNALFCLVDNIKFIHKRDQSLTSPCLENFPIYSNVMITWLQLDDKPMVMAVMAPYLKRITLLLGT